MAGGFVPLDEARTRGDLVDIGLVEAERDAADARTRLARSANVGDPTLRGGLRHFREGDDVALMVGGSIPGETKTIAIAIYDRVQAFDTEAAGVMAATLVAISFVTIAATYLLSARLGRRLT